MAGGTVPDAEWLTVNIFAPEDPWCEPHGTYAQSERWHMSLADGPLQSAPTQLEDAQLTFGGWVDLLALLAHPNILTHLVHPQRDNRTGQEQMVQPLRVRQAALGQFATTRLVIAEALLDVHPLQVLFQTSEAWTLVRNDGAEFG